MNELLQTGNASVWLGLSIVTFAGVSYGIFSPAFNLATNVGPLSFPSPLLYVPHYYVDSALSAFRVWRDLMSRDLNGLVISLQHTAEPLSAHRSVSWFLCFLCTGSVAQTTTRSAKACGKRLVQFHRHTPSTTHTHLSDGRWAVGEVTSWLSKVGSAMLWARIYMYLSVSMALEATEEFPLVVPCLRHSLNHTASIADLHCLLLL